MPRNGQRKNLSNEKLAPGCLLGVGDEILPTYVGITPNHEIRIPIKQILNNQYFMESKEGPFFPGSFGAVYHSNDTHIFQFHLIFCVFYGMDPILDFSSVCVVLSGLESLTS